MWAKNLIFRQSSRQSYAFVTIPAFFWVSFVTCNNVLAVSGFVIFAYHRLYFSWHFAAGHFVWNNFWCLEHNICDQGVSVAVLPSRQRGTKHFADTILVKWKRKWPFGFCFLVGATITSLWGTCEVQVPPCEALNFRGTFCQKIWMARHAHNLWHPVCDLSFWGSWRKEEE